MGTTAAKENDEQSYVPPVEEKKKITHIDFDDDSDGDDEMDTQRREVRHKFASSDSAGRMALERLRSQESEKNSTLTNDEKNLEQIEASFIKMTMTPSPERPKQRDSKPYQKDMQPEDERAFDSRNKGLVQHTDKNELLSKIQRIVQEGGGVDQLQFLLERAAIIGVDEKNPIILQAYSACNVWKCSIYYILNTHNIYIQNNVPLIVLT